MTVKKFTARVLPRPSLLSLAIAMEREFGLRIVQRWCGEVDSGHMWKDCYTHWRKFVNADRSMRFHSPYTPFPFSLPNSEFRILPSPSSPETVIPN